MKLLGGVIILVLGFAFWLTRESAIPENLASLSGEAPQSAPSLAQARPELELPAESVADQSKMRFESQGQIRTVEKPTEPKPEVDRITPFAANPSKSEKDVVGVLQSKYGLDEKSAHDAFLYAVDAHLKADSGTDEEKGRAWADYSKYMVGQYGEGVFSELNQKMGARGTSEAELDEDELDSEIYGD